MSFAKNGAGLGKITPLIIFLIVLLIYLSFPTKNYYWDAIEFALTIESADSLNASLLHPNHLFYNVAGYLAFQFARTFSPSMRAIEVLQILNSIFGAASVTAFFLILKNLLRRTYLNLSLTALFAFSAMWWKFSTDGGSYVPGIFFILVSFYLILPNQKPRPLAAALAHSLAMVFHQLAVFFLPVIILGIILQTTSIEPRRRIYALVQYGLTVFLLTFGTFCLSFYWLRGTFNYKEFFGWVTWYSPEVGFVFSLPNILSSLVKSHAKLLFDGRFSFFKFDFLDTVLLGLLVVSVVIFFANIGRDLKIFGIIRRTIANKTFYTNPAFLLCVAWVLPFFLFLAVFIPGNAFYKLFYLPPIIILIGLIARNAIQKNQIGRWRLGALAAIVFLVNFIFFVHPSADVREDSPLSLALQMNEQWSDKTVVYYDKMNTDTNLVKYFNPLTVWVKFDSAEEFENRLRNVSRENGAVWFDDTALERVKSSPELRERISKIAVEKARFQLNNPAHAVKFVRIEPVF